MGKVVQLPRHVSAEFLSRAAGRLEAELKADHELERRTVDQAFVAVLRGDFDAEPVRQVIRGAAGELAEYVDLCELIKLVSRVQGACGYQPVQLRCSCTARCAAWPHCAGGPEGI